MVAVAILTAGKGTRMKSSLPKVLHRLGQRTLVERVLRSCQSIEVERQFVIVGYQGELVQRTLADLSNLEFVEQREQLGTGHAVQQLLPHLQGYEGPLLVLNGDVPLLRPESIAQLVETHQQAGNAATLLTARLPDPKGYGRVFCSDRQIVTEIIEDKDCNPEQRLNDRINAGVYCFDWGQLADFLPKLSSNNKQNEFYLTEAIAHLNPVMAVDVGDYEEISGINDRLQLSRAETVLLRRIKDDWLRAGVTMISPETITIDDTVELCADVVIEPGTHLRGDTVVGAGSRLGPGSLIENSRLGTNVSVLYSVVSDSGVANDTRIGPYAHLRGRAEVGEGCRIGNFVEIKKAKIGAETNAAHLAYLGDATLGESVNVGAGTITANYDGYKKHATVIGDRSKTGANSVLVAPVNLGSGVTVAAGSVVTKDVADDCLVIARSRQREIANWQNPSQSQETPPS
ncbi:MAG: bifunctional UDP-N-acetylglucosamine diphosphorylase/glucosamine-1-phosphate N-acetyltransferase GlmU [Cyanobacteria bacterium P01_H01_bin.15]